MADGALDNARGAKIDVLVADTGGGTGAIVRPFLDETVGAIDSDESTLVN